MLSALLLYSPHELKEIPFILAVFISGITTGR